MSNSRVTQGVAIASEWSLAEIDVLCDAFEDALRRGEEPRIGDYLEQCEGPLRGTVFAELMQVELELRPESGSHATYRQYLSQFPEYSDVIETIAFKHGLTTSHSPGLCPGVSSEPGSSPRDNPRAEPGAMEEVPSRIAHFQLQEKLGTGGMGEVWRAWDSRLKRTVAIKIPRNRQLSEQELHRFLREGRAAGQLNHPHIVSVHEVGRDGHLAFIVSDFIEGQSLQQWLANRVVPLHRAAEVCAQLAEALHHAHEHGIVHRDLKPSNILLSADGSPHVVDFGIAKWTDDTLQLTLDGFALGTPAYMSPEQARGDSAHVDRRADVYALGAILYTMLTGKAPFTSDTPTAVLRAVLDDSPPLPRSLRRDIPRDLETICLKAMEKEPSRRYATAEAMAADLARFMRGDPILGRRPSLLEKTARLVRKRPAAAVAVMLGLLSIAAFGFAGVLARENRSLQGLIPITLETKPPGARVVFVPLHPSTQEPEAEKAVYPTMRSPVNAEIKPGDYLVVAALDDGRFHEVYRRVPKDSSEIVNQRTGGWHRSGEGIVLNTINIPDLNVTEGMAWVDPNVGKATELSVAPRQLPFYVDVRELTYGDCPACLVRKNGDLQRKVLLDHAITVDFDSACDYAEMMGKRLPTVGEYVSAALQPKMKTCTDVDFAQTEFGPAGTPECDRVGHAMPIAGLYSNVAEWTTTALGPAEQNKGAFANLNIPQISLYRIIKGGDMAVVDGNPSAAPEHRDPNTGFGIERYRTKPGVGFRCVRSASPRFLSTP
ncbi:MAG: protein kinase [Planctomycetes bacterium]|nr:protein kinase [Planctomycetota bacterium]